MGTTKMAVLPNISPNVSTGLVLTSMLPVLVLIWRRPQPQLFPMAVAYMTMCR